MRRVDALDILLCLAGLTTMEHFNAPQAAGESLP
jgi:hypothetical protein